MLDIEIEVREESGKALVQILQSMSDRMADEVRAERHEREGTQKVFLEVLQKSMQRIQTGIAQLTPRGAPLDSAQRNRAHTHTQLQQQQQQHHQQLHQLRQDISQRRSAH